MSSVNSAYLLAAIAFVSLLGCSPHPEGVQPGDKWQQSSSVAEAKKRGTLISEVEIIPNRWNVNGKEITFEEAWLERMPDGYFLGPFALCFHIDKGKEVFGAAPLPILVLGEKRENFLLTRNPRYVQLTDFLDSDDLTHVRASLVKDYDEKRQKNIRFVRKDMLPDKKN